MIANVVNTLQQFTGIASAALVVRPGYLRESLFEYISHPKDTAAEIAEKSSFMQHRTAASAFEIQRSIDDIMLDPSKYQKAKSFAMRHGYFMQQATQSVVDIVVWRGAYNQSIAKGADEQGAIRQADSAVRMTQGTFAAEDLSKIETGSAGMRMFTMFYSYFNTQANLVGSAFVKQIRETGFSAPGKLFYIYMMGVMVPSVVAEAIAQVLRGEVFDDDDDEWYLKSLLDIFFLGQARFLAAAVPFGGQVVTAAINTANDKWFDDRISTSPAISMLEAAGRTFVQHPYRAISEDKELNVRMATRDLLTTMQLFTGLPFGALARPAGYAAGVLEGRYEPINEADLVRGLITGRAIQQ